MPKPRPGIEYTETTKEDAQIDWTKGMQDRMLNTNSVLKQERFSSTATTKEDAQINRYKGMQDRMLYSNPAIKQERLSLQPNTNPRDTSAPHTSFQTNSLVTEAPKLTMHVNPGSGPAKRHAQISSTVKNCASSINRIGCKDRCQRTPQFTSRTEYREFRHNDESQIFVGEAQTIRVLGTLPLLFRYVGMSHRLDG